MHAAREDAQCVLHVHTQNGVAVSAQRDGLLPISRHSLLVLDGVLRERTLRMQRRP